MRVLLFAVSILLGLASPALAQKYSYYDDVGPDRESIYYRRTWAATIVPEDAELAARAAADPVAADALGQFNTALAAYTAGDYLGAQELLTAALAQTQSYALWHNLGATWLMLDAQRAPLPREPYFDEEEHKLYYYEADPWATQALAPYSAAAGWLAYQGRPVPFSLLRDRGAAYFEQGDYDLALADWQAALALPEGSADVDLQANAALALYHLDRWPEAVAGFQRALERRPAGQARRSAARG
jgi:tetratricopeptide (TPR) repeat protein